MLYIQEAADPIRIMSDKCVRVTGWSTLLVQGQRIVNSTTRTGVFCGPAAAATERESFQSRSLEEIPLQREHDSLRVRFN